MSVDDLRPYFGKRCIVRLRCRACRSGHAITGRLEAGRHVGDVSLQGHTFSLEDIEAVSPSHGGPPRRGSLLPLLREPATRLLDVVGQLGGGVGLRAGEGGRAG